MAENDYLSLLGENWRKEVDDAEKRLDDLIQKIVALNNVNRGNELEVINASNYSDAVRLMDQLAASERRLAEEAARAARLQEQLNTQREDARVRVTALEAAQARLTRAQSEEGRALAVVAEQTRRATAENRAAAQAQLSAAGSTDALRAELRTLTLQYDAMDPAARAAGNAGAALQEQINSLTQTISEAEEGTGRFGRGVGDYPQTFSAAVQALQAARTELIAQRDAVEDGSDAYRVLNTQVEQLDTVLDSNETRVIGARTAQRALREVSLELADTLGVQSEAFRNVTNVAGGLTDAIGDTQSVINRAASDTRAFDEVLGAAQGLAGAFGVAEGAAVLFGASQEDVQKSQERLMAIMTVLQSLQEVQNALQSESAAMAFVNTVRTKALAVAIGVKNFVMTGSIRATVADTVATGALGVATVATTTATTGATVAMRIFRVAMLATGIGAIIVGLGYLASAMGLFGDDTDDASESTKSLNEQTKELISNLEATADRMDKLRNARRGGYDDLQREVNLMKARGDAAEDIQKKETQMNAIVVAQAKERLTFANAYLAAKRKEGNVTQAILEKQAELEKDYKDKVNAGEVASAAFKKGVEDKALADSKKTVKEKKEKAVKEAEDNRAAIVDEQARLIEINAAAQKQIAEDETVFIAQRLQAQKAYYEETLRAAIMRNDIEQKLTLEEIGKAGNGDKRVLLEATYTRLKAEANLLRLQNTAEALQQEKALYKGFFDALEVEIPALTKPLLDVNKFAGMDSEEFEKNLSIFQQYQQAALDLAGIFKIQSEERLAQLDAEKEAVSARYETEIEGIANSMLSQEDKALKTSELNAAKQQEEEAIAAKQKEEKRRQAQFEKDLTIANIILNTAALVISEYLKGSFPAALAAGIVGAAQLAVALATPIPAYKDGTEFHPGGPAKVGDGGVEEVVQTPDGQYFLTPKTTTLMNLKRGSKVYKSAADFTRRQQSDWAVGEGGILIKLPDNSPALEDAIGRQTRDIVSAVLRSRPNIVFNGIDRDFEARYKRRTR